MITRSCAALSSKKGPHKGFEIDARAENRRNPRSEDPAVWTGFLSVPSPAHPMRRWNNDDQSTDDFTSRLQGLWLPLITPFRDGELDEASLRRLVRHGLRGRPRRRLHSRGDVGRRHDAPRGRTGAAGDGDASANWRAAATACRSCSACPAPPPRGCWMRSMRRRPCRSTVI